MTVHIDMKYDKSLTETNKIYRAILIVKFHSARIQYLRDSKTDPKDPEIGLTELGGVWSLQMELFSRIQIHSVFLFTIKIGKYINSHEQITSGWYITLHIYIWNK